MKSKFGRGVWLAMGCFLLLHATSKAQSTCPWLNGATASGALGGSATAEVSELPDNTGTCLFRVGGQAANATLRISVIKASQPEDAGKEMMPLESKCASSTVALRGVGNEAILCGDDAGPSHAELVVGRVRDHIFTVAINTDSADAADAAPDALAKKTEAIARQVAGALF